MAVGQRVTALHPKERHLYTGTVLTPDGDHYRVQFDKQKQGVQLVQDICLMPLLDGSRGIDFTSPHSTGQDPGASWAEGGARLVAAPPQGAARADGCELQLVAYTVRLLERKDMLASRLKSICAEAEAELLARADAAYGGAGGASGTSDGAASSSTDLFAGSGGGALGGSSCGRPGSVMVGGIDAPRPAAPPQQQPALSTLLRRLRATRPLEAQQLTGSAAVWRQEMAWVQVRRSHGACMAWYSHGAGMAEARYMAWRQGLAWVLGAARLPLPPPPLLRASPPPPPSTH
jgi:hypothetical protein